MATLTERIASAEAALDRLLSSGLSAHSTGDQSFSNLGPEELQRTITMLKRQLEREENPKFGGRTFATLRRD